jgi:hypothetical protein
MSLCCSWTCLSISRQKPDLHLEVFRIQEPVLLRVVSSLQRPVLHLEVFTPQGQSCTWSCLQHRGLRCTWTCLHDWASVVNLTSLDFKNLCCSWTCPHFRGLCCTRMILHHTTGARAEPGPKCTWTCLGMQQGPVLFLDVPLLLYYRQMQI